MKILVLSYFDELIGPSIFHVLPEQCNEEDMAFIKSLLDLNDQGFFVYQKGSYNSVNLQFQVESKGARGGKVLFMISLVLLREQINPLVFKEFLNVFVEEFSKIKDVRKGLQRTKQEGDEMQKYMQLHGFFHSFYRILPKEMIIRDRNVRIMMVGLHDSGITAILDKFRTLTSKQTKFHKKVSAKRLFLENLIITTYRIPVRKGLEELFDYYLKIQDAIVVVIDANDPSNFPKVRKQLKIISECIAEKNISLMLDFNKIDLTQRNFKKIRKELDLDALNFSNYKAFPVSAKTEEGLIESFNWVSSEILKNIFRE